MIQVTCPWCEAELGLGLAELDGAELQCAGCSTRWELSDPLVEVALAA